MQAVRLPAALVEKLSLPNDVGLMVVSAEPGGPGDTAGHPDRRRAHRHCRQARWRPGGRAEPPRRRSDRQDAVHAHHPRGRAEDRVDHDRRAAARTARAPRRTEGAMIGASIGPLGGELEALASALRRSVVEVRTRGAGAGSGIIWSANGLIVTNAHVARTEHATVVLWDGARARGHRHGARPATRPGDDRDRSRQRHARAGRDRPPDRPPHGRRRGRARTPVGHHRRDRVRHRPRGRDATRRATLDPRRHPARAGQLGRAAGRRARPCGGGQHPDRRRAGRRRSHDDRVALSRSGRGAGAAGRGLAPRDPGADRGRVAGGASGAGGAPGQERLASPSSPRRPATRSPTTSRRTSHRSCCSRSNRERNALPNVVTRIGLSPDAVPRTPAFVLLADAPSLSWTADALRGGARSVLPRDATPDEIIAALEAAAAGLVTLPADLARRSRVRAAGPGSAARRSVNAAAHPPRGRGARASGRGAREQEHRIPARDIGAHGENARGVHSHEARRLLAGRGRGDRRASGPDSAVARSRWDASPSLALASAMLRTSRRLVGLIALGVGGR